MPNVAVSSGNNGTLLAGATGTKITGLAVVQPTAASDFTTPLELIDQAAAPANAAAAALPPKTLFCGSLINYTNLVAITPVGPDPAPGLVDPVWPKNLFQGADIPFSKGVWVRNCPAGLAFTLTTA